jgi:biopolymer transport protein ExbB/TolQ
VLLQASLPSWLTTLLQVGGWLAAAITIYINWRNYHNKNKESTKAQITKEAGRELLGWTLNDRLELERWKKGIESKIEAQDEVHELLEKLMANVLRNTGNKNGQ